MTKEDAERVKFLMAGETGIRKVANCVPHDIGDPGRFVLQVFIRKPFLFLTVSPSLSQLFNDTT